jgi:hypothetical protein
VWLWLPACLLNERAGQCGTVTTSDCLQRSKFLLARLFWAGLLGCLLAGCASGRHHGQAPLDPSQGLAAAEPPFFLVGPVGAVLTNSQDFSARIVVSLTNGVDVLTAGNLFQNEGVLLYVPKADQLTRSNTWAGSFRFLWDVAQNSGYILSERLRGYTPTHSPVHYNAPASQPPTGPPVVTQIEGQPCWKDELTVSSSNGEQTHLQVWWPQGESGPPLRIISPGDAARAGFIVQLSEPNLDPLAPDLFVLSPAFVHYASAEAMVRQLKHKEPVLPYSQSDRRRR